MSDKHKPHTEIKDWFLGSETQTDRPFPTNLCLHELFEDQAQKSPESIAVVFGELHLTYQELDERSNQLAHVLLTQGVGPDSIVGLCIERSLELVIALFGILKAGGAYLPLDPEAPKKRLQQIIEDARAFVCLAQEHTRPLLPEETSVVILQSDWKLLDHMSRQKPEVPVTSQHLVSVYYTSGSTGNPKGVASEHIGWVNRMTWMQRQHQLLPGETILHKTTLTFDDSALELFWPLMVGGKVALIAPGLHRDPRAILDAAITYHTALLQTVPSMLNMILDAVKPEERSTLASLRNVVSSGEALYATTLRHFQEKMPGKLHNTWGATEVSIDSTIHTCGEDDAKDQGAICIGKPFDNNQVYILDADLKEVPIGTIGDLYLAGIGLARGYLHDPERTAQTFLANPFRRGERMYRTGDQGYFRPDGSIKFMGRVDHQVKIRGMRVELGEIEAVLLKHPRIKEAVVVIQEAIQPH